MGLLSGIRRSCRGLVPGAAALLLAACVGTGLPSLTSEPRYASTEQPAPATEAATAPVRVGLILPLSGGGAGAVAAAALKNAAEMALTEFQNAGIAVSLKDDRGTPDGAREAARQVIEEGAELIIGPLFGASVQAAAQVARPAGRPIIAFSTDAGVASRGVYLLSFMAESEVDRIVDYAAAQGRRSFAALIPEGTYGNVVEAQFREATARRGMRLTASERYPAGQPQGAVARIAPLVAGPSPQADALFVPDTAEGLSIVGQALAQIGFNPQRVKPLGTGVWDDARAFAVPALQGGWFATPDKAGFTTFAERYRARFGTDPTRIASLSYDAVSLAAALARSQGPERFSDAVLTSRSGFAGADGVFRFRPDGTNVRALAVLEVRNGTAAIVSPAPRSLGQSDT